MSYDIIYDKCFIRTSRGIIPMVLIGSSNCYESTFDSLMRKRLMRERHWSVIHDMMLEDASGQEKWQAMLSANPGAELFMEHGKWITGSNIRKWFANGVKAALPLENYLKWNRGQSFVCEIVWYKNRSEFASTTEFTYHCHNTEELENWIDQAKSKREAMLKDMPAADIYLKVGFDDNRPLNSVPRIEGPVVVKRGNNAYVCKYETKKSRTFTDDPAKAYVFTDIDEAIEELGIVPGNGGVWSKVTFVSAKTVQKGRPWIVQIGTPSFRAGSYIQKITRGKLYSTTKAEHAYRYSSKAAACKAADKAVFRFNLGTRRFLICNTEDGAEFDYLVGASTKEDV